jgi:hypothetical protein
VTIGIPPGNVGVREVLKNPRVASSEVLAGRMQSEVGPGLGSRDKEKT